MAKVREKCEVMQWNLGDSFGESLKGSCDWNE